MEAVCMAVAGRVAVLADCNQDGLVNNADIEAFVTLLVGN
jgi:hypothetical protein